VREIDKDLWLWDGLEDAEARQKAVHGHLAGLLGCAPSSLHIVRDDLGRPLIEKPSTPLQFSQARRDGMVALAADEDGRAVGVDVEIPQSGPWIETVAGDFFSAAEKRWLRGLDDSERADSFFRLWTAKEAVLKALGLGIAQGMAEPDFKSQLAKGHPFEAEAAQVEAFGKSFHLKWYFPQVDNIPLVLCRAVQNP
jgi:4'-phosphopantetheinyl transferase